jgi:cytochrome c553
MSAAFQNFFARRVTALLAAAMALAFADAARATPAHRAALDRHYDKFLAKELSRCTTCHQPSDNKNPKNLDEFPHNAFGKRLRAVGEELKAAGKSADIPARLAAIAAEDSDGDGVANEIELLLGHQPGDAKDVPSAKELQFVAARQAEFKKFLASYRWRPFETVDRPAVPAVRAGSWVRNPIDAFIASEHEARGLKPRPEAGKEVLLRRVYLDLIGLSPTPEEQRAFLADTGSDAYEKVVKRLLDDPRHGERWGRHWMDVWRYSDWAGWSGGNQIRDSKPHIWRWRDWIVESLNRDKGYDRMVIEMLAADEAAPLDADALRATGFLVRNFKMLSREQWMEDTIKHTAQAFLGVTMGCAKCHDHMTEAISQADYYRMRAIFDPHNVRTDKISGQLDTAKDGIVRAFDKSPEERTYLLVRGDERHPDTNRVMEAGVPAALCGTTALAKVGGKFDLAPVKLPTFAAQPDSREFVIKDTIAASERTLADAREALEKLKTNAAPDADKLKEQQL